jgi:hypothetical protein
MELFSNHKAQAIQLYRRARRADPTLHYADLLSYVFYGKNDLASTFLLFDGEESLSNCSEYMERVSQHGEFGLANMHRIGYAYWKLGMKEESNDYFDRQMEYSMRQNQLGRTWSEQLFTTYDLAALAAFRGEKEQAYVYLETFSQRKIMQWWMLWNLKHDPLFNTIRDEPDFQQIVREAEIKFQAEHERVRKWLEDSN